MKKIMYAILALSIVAALVAGAALVPTMFGVTANAASQQPAQTNNQALEQENEGVYEQDNDDTGLEANEEESIDTNLASQAKITADEAGVIAANHLSVQPTALQSVELENEGDLHYSVALTKDNHTFDVEVDAITGDVGTVEQDD